MTAVTPTRPAPPGFEPVAWVAWVDHLLALHEEVRLSDPAVFKAEMRAVTADALYPGCQEAVLVASTPPEGRPPPPVPGYVAGHHWEAVVEARVESRARYAASGRWDPVLEAQIESMVPTRASLAAAASRCRPTPQRSRSALLAAVPERGAATRHVPPTPLKSRPGRTVTVRVRLAGVRE